MFKNRAIKKYFNSLYPYLKSRYGASDAYSKGQIVRTISECGFSKNYIVYALAIFLQKEEFEALSDEFPGVELNSVRSEIAKKYFNGDYEYSYKDARSRFVGNEGHCSGMTDVGSGD